MLECLSVVLINNVVFTDGMSTMGFGRGFKYCLVRGEIQ
jgi:hypothetical protein